MTKSELRRAFLDKRKVLTPEEVNQWSQGIAERLFAYLAQEGIGETTGFVHCFLPIRRQNEVNTWLVIRKIWTGSSSVGISVPVVTPVSHQLTHYTLRPDTLLTENRLGIPEPAPGHRHKTDLSQITAVLVPLLAFDEQGHRVGYGGGYYDRFLASVPNARRIGVSLFEPVTEIEGIESTDVPLDVCITPSQTCIF